MHVQIVTYRMIAISDDDFVAANREFADAMAAMPGLIAKIWLNKPDEDLHGGTYLWRDRDAYEAFLASELWAEVLADESLSDLKSVDYETMDELTRLTQPGAELV